MGTVFEKAWKGTRKEDLSLPAQTARYRETRARQEIAG